MVKNQKVGSLGDIGCFSFYPTKNLGCFGDGGMVVTNNKNYYKKIISLRNHGSLKRYIHTELGFNSRLDEIQAAILNIKLKYINNSNFAIIPSRSEAFPFVYQEFLNSGKIPLCTDIDVFKELSERKNHIFSSKDYQSFSKCIDWASTLCEEEYLKYIKDLYLKNNHCRIFHKN